MRKLIMTMWVTLDGFIAGPNNEMDWLGSFDPAMGQYEDSFVTAADTLLLGRVTYESFAGAWPNVPNNPNADPAEVAYAHKLNAMRKIVFSRTLESVEWNNSSLRQDVVPAEIIQLKQETGRDIIIYGSASLVQTLTNLGLIDEYQLLLHPVVLGSGKPLFKNIEHKMNLQLGKTKTLSSGVVVLYYQSAQK